ncbi:MAG: hypothetical protein DI539_00765 [Flavobacterium psychrophilum]|nr:MAG: hypothetical protein DI539_00765 [Flavobacterium psychrophilum]
MDYATHNSGAVSPAPRQKPKAATPRRRGIHPATLPPQGCRRGAARQAAICPAGAAAYGFLKYRFLPHFVGRGKAEAPQEEEAFFRSLGLLTAHYGISLTPTRHHGYPYSRALALWEADKLLRKVKEESIGLEVQQQDNTVCLAVTETYCTGNTLYYIPLVPLHYLMQDRRRRRGAALLLGVCGYLFHKAGMPHYHDESSYLCWQYDMIAEWVEADPEGWEQEYYWQQRSQLHEAQHIGGVMLRRLWNTYSLEHLQANAEKLVPRNTYDWDCLTLAQDCLQLMRDYPQESLYRNADRSVLPDLDGNGDEDCITMDKYIGFCADTKGWLYQTLSECVNAEFGEYTQIQEPVLRRIFDGRAQENDSLDFECRLFHLMDDLCDILNNKEYGNR